MKVHEFEGINSAIIGLAKFLLEEGTERKTRGNTCYEIPYPVVFKLNNPLARIVTIPERKWRNILPYVESLWLCSGRNDLAMVQYYLERMGDFSDDGKTMRAGYGPRFRFFQTDRKDYDVGFFRADFNRSAYVDQFKFIVNLLNSDSSSRRAVITIGDPSKDLFDLNGEVKITKDYPCTQNIQFMVNNGKLDVYVHMRSNDYMWGATGVNIFNFTYLQEIFGYLLGMELGAYYHIANNFHYYDRHKKKLEVLASISNVENEFHVYDRPFTSLEDFDAALAKLENFERGLRLNQLNYFPDFESNYFNDWARVLYAHYFPEKEIIFENPVLQKVVINKL
ncbi:thymidylate synthase [Parapedobacter koreensis]|uniref:Thymidylate synthase n=1 Tax=Parapedobacter koreensis TaxID=332977 RepID=A0A1H7SCT8_9SPHI|nr:thymidylate synthase [Parapedobacter koreensis]SEL70119.1 thymidylate synthase [Parapedobacter koreensis]